MQHQDWNTVVFNKKKTPPKKVSQEIPKYIKIDNDVDNLSHERFTNHKKLIEARIAQNMSQKQLALKCNMNVNLLQKYESGIQIPNNNDLQKLRKVLNIKL